VTGDQTMKMILENQVQGWTVRLFGVTGMPEAETLPLPFTHQAPLALVVRDMQSRFPGAMIQYRRGHQLTLVRP
jgi:hypothetical protein